MPACKWVHMHLYTHTHTDVPTYHTYIYMNDMKPFLKNAKTFASLQRRSHLLFMVLNVGYPSHYCREVIIN